MSWSYVPGAGSERTFRALKASLGRFADVTVSSAYTPTADDDLVLVNTAFANVTVRLPTVDAALRGKRLTIVKTFASGSLFIQPPTGQTVDGSASTVTVTTAFAPRRYQAVELTSTPTYGWVSV